MQLRLFAHALVIVGAAMQVACGGTTGTMGTVEDTGGDPGPPKDSATTIGTGDDAVSSAGTTISGAGEDMESGVFQGHPLDDPQGELAARTIYFEFDSSEVMETERAAIQAHARYLSEHPGAQLTLEGHADERGSREYNIALGEQRAEAVRRLMTLLGAASQQIRTISYGEERSASAGHDESAWRLNRRVEVVYRVRE